MLPHSTLLVWIKVAVLWTTESTGEIPPCRILYCSNNPGIEEIKANMSHIARLPVFMILDQVWHKSDCTTTEDVRGLKIWFQEGEVLYHLCSKNNGADQLHSYCTANLHLWLLNEQKAGFLMTRLI